MYYFSMPNTGQLAEVNNFNRLMASKNLSYMWQPPYSLDLTAVMPDVIYCLEISRITCGVRESVISDCDITDRNYTVDLDIADLYEAIITPRSNVANAINGSKASVSGVCIDITFAIILKLILILNRQIHFHK